MVNKRLEKIVGNGLIATAILVNIPLINMAIGYRVTRNRLSQEPVESGVSVAQKIVSDYSSRPYAAKVLVYGNYLAAQQHLDTVAMAAAISEFK